MNPATAAVHHPARHIHDPGARRILLLILAAAPKLRRDGHALATATHATPGRTPGHSVAMPDAAGLARAIASFHRDLQSLRNKIGPVRCRSSSGRRGKADMMASLLELDAGLQAFITSVVSSDRTVKAAHAHQAARLNKSARATAKTAVALLSR
jgi:hypothetical protein